MEGIVNAVGRFFLHIYCVLLNRQAFPFPQFLPKRQLPHLAPRANRPRRHSFLGLLRHILINMTWILLWITTFKNGMRCDPVKPHLSIADPLHSLADRLLDSTGDPRKRPGAGRPHDIRHHLHRSLHTMHRLGTGLFLDVRSHATIETLSTCDSAPLCAEHPPCWYTYALRTS